MGELRIFDGLPLPLDAATQTFAWIARKGAGKTYGAGKLTEQLIDAGVQVVVLDTVGNWYGLRLAADGRGVGLDVPVLGGLRGDIPLTPTAGDLVADVVVDTGRSLIIDLSQYSKGDRQRFATAFAERLWLRKKGEADPAPIHLVLEEAQLVIPQMVRGDSARMVGIWEEIVRLGRNYGIGVSLLSQRPQSVNKEALTQTECLVVLQVNGTPERKALREWIVEQGLTVDLLNELPGLPIGTAYVWSPQWLRHLGKHRILPKRTFDASATPKVGERRARGELAPVDLEALRERMAASIERAEKDDPKRLRAQIAELRRQLAERPKAEPERIVERVEVPAISDAELRRLDDLAEKLDAAARLIAETAPSLIAFGSAIGGAVRAIRGDGPPSEPAAIASEPSPPVPIRRAQAAPPAVARAADTPSLKAGERKMLHALAQFEGRGLTRPQLATLTGFSASSGTFRNYVGHIKGLDLVAEDGGVLSLAAAGRGLAQDAPRRPQTTAELVAMWGAALKKGEREMLDLLVDLYPRTMTRGELAERTGYAVTSGTFRNYVGHIKGLGLVQESHGALKAGDALFLDAAGGQGKAATR